MVYVIITRNPDGGYWINGIYSDVNLAADALKERKADAVFPDRVHIMSVPVDKETPYHL